MSDANNTYSIQRFRGGFAIVWWETDTTGKRDRKRTQLQSQDRPSAEAEAEALWAGVDDQPWTIGRIVPEYIKTLEGQVSYPRRKDAWKAMKPFWEKVMPSAISDDLCKRYRASRHVGDATARYELQIISTAMNWAVKHGKIASKKSVWLPPKPEFKERHLSPDEFARFYEGLGSEHAKLFAMIGISTLARPGAILGLTWDRVDFMRRRINFFDAEKQKTNKRRAIVPIGDKLLVALQTAYHARTSLYVVEWAGERVKNIRKAFERASERSGVHATPYTLRHTGAVWAAENGVAMPELAQMMGHDDDRTTQTHYARFTPDYLSRVVGAVEGSIRTSVACRN